MCLTFNGRRVELNSTQIEYRSSEPWKAYDAYDRQVAHEKELFYEIKDRTFRNVGGFCDKFFNPETWRKEQIDMVVALMKHHNGKKWTGFPVIADEQPVWAWLCSLEEHALAEAPHKLLTTNQFKESKGRMNFFFRTSRSGVFQCKDALVMGKQKKSYYKWDFKEDIIQLTRLIQRVFIDQPTRRFVHAFTLCGSIIELWVFDRSGVYSSWLFDIHKKPDLFARALVGYATMDHNTLGLDRFIERGTRMHRHITLDDPNGEETRIRLVDAGVRHAGVISRGTTCFLTKESHVAKFSWVSNKRKLEVELLKLAEERGVEGVVRVVAHRQITTTNELRKDLKFWTTHEFPNQDYYSYEDVSSAAEGMNNESLGNIDATPGLANPRKDPWENRIYSCLVVSPVGRLISDFRSAKEMLELMRDAIRAHKSLYITGNILHRDISTRNIIITNPETAGSFKGMLIDLDHAKQLDSASPDTDGEQQRLGTLRYMAIEVLDGRITLIYMTWNRFTTSYCGCAHVARGIRRVLLATTKVPLQRASCGVTGKVLVAGFYLCGKSSTRC